MGLKGKWQDKINNVDYIVAEDINDIANSVIELEDKIEGGNSSAVLLVTAQQNTSTREWTVDKTFAEITEAVKKGTAILQVTHDSVTEYYYSSLVEPTVITFCSYDVDGEQIFQNLFIIDSTNEVYQQTVASGAGVKIIDIISNDGYTSETTWQELIDSVNANKYIVARFSDMMLPISAVSPNDVNVTFQAVSNGNLVCFEAKQGTAGSIAFTLTQTRVIPQKGVDYWTEADKQEINNYIADELAKRGQLKPEFANSIEELKESGDTSKLYVLPDGYIYAYMYTTKKILGSTNQIPISKDMSGNIYNQTGFKDGYRLRSTAEETTQSGAFVTGFIPVKAGDILRFNSNLFSLSHPLSTSLNFVYFLSNFEQVAIFSMADTLSFEPTSIESNDAGYVTKTQVRSQFPAYSQWENIAYMRLTLLGTGEGAIVTINEEITEPIYVKEYDWTNTNHAFVPADYEDRIIALEEITTAQSAQLTSIEEINTQQDERISTLEKDKDKNKSLLPPEYWITAIEGKKNSIKEKQASGVDSFQFVWFSDMHGSIGYSNTNGAGTSSQANIGKISQYLCDTFGIPLVATSGDIMSQASHSNVDSVYAEYTRCWEILKYIDIEKFFAVIGNHDGAWGAPVDGVYYLKDIGNRALYNEVYRKQATDFKRMFGKDGTYFYVDNFPQRMRIIMLNSHTDGDGSNDDNEQAVFNSMRNSVYGSEQLAWLVDTLKNTPEGFTVIAMAHQPIATSKDGELLANVLTAYKNRSAYSGSVNLKGNHWGDSLESSPYNTSTITCDFSEAKGDFAAFFCGHVHIDQINTSQYSFPWLSITTAGADVRDSNPVERIVGTATETAIDIVTVDRKQRKIYTTRIGAGYDREIDY